MPTRRAAGKFLKVDRRGSGDVLRALPEHGDQIVRHSHPLLPGLQLYEDLGDALPGQPLVVALKEADVRDHGLDILIGKPARLGLVGAGDAIRLVQARPFRELDEHLEGVEFLVGIKIHPEKRNEHHSPDQHNDKTSDDPVASTQRAYQQTPVDPSKSLEERLFTPFVGIRTPGPFRVVGRQQNESFDHGCGQRQGEGQRDNAHELAHHARQEDQREEGRDVGADRTEDRGCHFARPEDRGFAGAAALQPVPVTILDHDDGVIHDDAQHHHHCEQRASVYRVAENAQQDEVMKNEMGIPSVARKAFQDPRNSQRTSEMRIIPVIALFRSALITRLM